MRALADRITATPIPFDRERAAAVLADADPALGRGAVGELIRAQPDRAPIWLG